MRIDQAKPGQIIETWHAAGDRQMDLIYARVLKVHRTKITVQDEWGNVARVYPTGFQANPPSQWFPQSLALVNANIA